jgi:hypothetical protein
MSAAELPTDSEELGNLIESGLMTKDLIDALIEQHGHCVRECEAVCSAICEAFTYPPLILLLEHNTDRLTIEQSELVYEKLEKHISPMDQGALANVWDARIRLAVGRGLVEKAKTGLIVWLDNEFLDGTFSEQEIQDSVFQFALRLADFEHCQRADLEAFIAAYHNPGEWRQGGLNCEDEVETCDPCQELLRLAIAKLNPKRA